MLTILSGAPLFPPPPPTHPLLARSHPSLQFRITKGGVNIVNIPVISSKATKTATASPPIKVIASKRPSPSPKASPSPSKSKAAVLQVCVCFACACVCVRVRECACVLQRVPSGWISVALPFLSCDVQGKGKKNNERVLRGDEEVGTEEEEVQE